MEKSFTIERMRREKFNSCTINSEVVSRSIAILSYANIFWRKRVFLSFPSKEKALTTMPRSTRKLLGNRKFLFLYKKQ